MWKGYAVLWNCVVKMVIKGVLFCNGGVPHKCECEHWLRNFILLGAAEFKVPNGGVLWWN